VICTIVGIVVLNCLTTNRPTPSEAAEILRPRQYVSVAPVPPLRPLAVVAVSNPGDGPFGPFPLSPPRRLDGTLYSEPRWSVSWQAPLQVEIVNGSRTKR
jgi:hypothetical protein